MGTDNAKPAPNPPHCHPYPHPPIPLSPRPFPINFYPTLKFLLRESALYAIQPLNKISNIHMTTKTWLIRVEESKPSEVQVKDPLFGFHLKNLSNKLPEFLNLLDYGVKEITKAYETVVISEENRSEFDGEDFLHCQKVVVSFCPNKSDDKFTVVALTSGGRVGVTRSGNREWTLFDRYFQDIVYHNEKFYALCPDGCTVAVDSKSLNIDGIAAPPLSAGVANYLAKLINVLYLINKYYLDSHYQRSGLQENSDDEYHHIHFTVLKLDEEKGQWVQVKSELEDIALFVGDDCSFSISAKEFDGCKGNCIYFVDDVFCKVKKGYPGWNVGIFDLDDNTASPLSAFPCHSKIFWPPPTWLKNNSSLPRC